MVLAVERTQMLNSYVNRGSMETLFVCAQPAPVVQTSLRHTSPSQERENETARDGESRDRGRHRTIETEIEADTEP